MNKPELKARYVSLVREGNLSKAQEVLQLIGSYKKPVEIKEDKIVTKKKAEPKKKATLESLNKIKGIGKKTVEDLKRIYKTVDDLKSALEKDAVPLRDDYVIKLKNHFRR